MANLDFVKAKVENINAVEEISYRIHCLILEVLKTHEIKVKNDGNFYKTFSDELMKVKEKALEGFEHLNIARVFFEPTYSKDAVNWEIRAYFNVNGNCYDHKSYSSTTVELKDPQPIDVESYLEALKETQLLLEKAAAFRKEAMHMAASFCISLTELSR